MNKLVDQTLLSASEKGFLAESIDCSLLEAFTGTDLVQQINYSGLSLIVRILFIRQNPNKVAKNRCRETYSKNIRGLYWNTVPAKYRGIDCDNIAKAVIKKPRVKKWS